MLLCEMPEQKHASQKAFWQNKNTEQNEAVSGELDALGRRSGQKFYQERKSEISRGRQLSAMSD
jgi:hypothetical protein